MSALLRLLENDLGHRRGREVLAGAFVENLSVVARTDARAQSEPQGVRGTFRPVDQDQMLGPSGSSG